MDRAERNTLRSRTAALIRRIAAADIGDAGIWLLDAANVRWDLPHLCTSRRSAGSNLCLGLTGPLLNVATGPFRRKRGWLRTDNDFVAILSDLILGDDAFAAVSLHEFAHWLSQPQATADGVIAAAQRGQLERLHADAELSHAEAHDGRFARSLAHVYHRARLAGFGAAPSAYRGVRGFETIVGVLHAEAGQNLGRSIREILDEPLSPAFQRVVQQLGIGYRSLPAATRVANSTPRPRATSTAKGVGPVRVQRISCSRPIDRLVLL